MSELHIQDLAQREKLKQRRSEHKKAFKRLSQKALYRDVSRVMDETGIDSPAGYLARVMSGEDPRVTHSGLLDIIDEIYKRGVDALPTLDEWIMICDVIRNNEMYTKVLVPLEHSNKAAEVLSKHLYPRKTELKAKQQIDATIEVKPLSKKEIKKFKKIFEQEY